MTNLLPGLVCSHQVGHLTGPRIQLITPIGAVLGTYNRHAWRWGRGR